MRNNQPVTAVETVIPEGEFIYSRTNLQGTIEEANDAFANISAYTRAEMIGQPHNMVRHPDMPEAAFADLWADLKAGRPWRGLVKNRRKDGGYYWVVANASPVRENGQIVGYQSVRARPTRPEIAAADAAYRRIKEGDQSLRVEHGRVVRVLPRVVDWFASLHTQMLLMGLLAVVPGMVGLLSSLLEGRLLNHVHDVLAVIAALYALYFLFWVTPRVSRDLQATADHLETVLCTGDLKTRLDINRRDIIGRVARLADNFIASVQATVQGMADTAKQVDDANNHVRAGVHNVNQSAVVQSDATSASAAAVEQVTVSIGEVAAHAASTEAAAHKAGDVAQAGEELSLRASNTILSLAGTVKASAQQVESLGQRSEEISRIVAVIKEVADQTNLLALNAAIEAARAGEAGRGFSVVADEVRKLAERTGKATQEISTMISSIQAETKQAVEGMRSGAHEVEESVRLVQEAREALRGINEQMRTTVSMVSEITHSSNEQQSAMTELAQNVERVASMTEQNVSVTRETEAMVDVLTATVTRMRKAVGQYRV
ncbi:PAS domain-containing methyl-accepting chemotaxis protein [Accumulibacter sp.]|uniref:methyl-accepting chemotaxis protein n=1 Tax=Accumulibacter sp. TaxID=2053492 RepID=UPI002C1AECB0|nr:PAS domain-containing methyl-accepting chemotaxis protein [Accumulibacter sp.]HPU81771.1 PAS domain-containing methyl-accepting chemotaxis protein [Accumulibacter sp.]